MGFFDALLGRSKPVLADLDRLFSLPSAAITLQVDAGLVSTETAAVSFKPATGSVFAEIEAEVTQLLGMADNGGGTRWSRRTDQYGYEWVTITIDGLEELVTKVHMVNSSLQDKGFGQQLLCSVFAFKPAPDAAPNMAPKTYLVYLYKRGSFYPFVPLGGDRRDNELELRLKGILEKELPMEADLSRWFPLWGLPF